MRTLTLLTTLTILGAARVASGQGFTVLEMEPAGGTTDVPLESQIRFEFSEEVAVTNDWNEVVLVEPKDSIDINRVSLLVDGEGVPRIVVFTARHTPNTEFSWLLHSIKSADADPLDEAVSLRYATASTMGQRTVSGTVSAPGAGKFASVSAAREASLRQIAHALAERGTPAFRPTERSGLLRSAGDPTADALAPEERLAFTEVVLLQDLNLHEPQWHVAAASGLLGSAGSYTIPFVSPGLYAVVAARYGADGAIDALGFYDVNEDGAPDALNIGSMDRSKISVALQAYERSDARSFETRARAAYPGAGDDPLILIKDTYGSTPEGLAHVWTYQFYDVEQNRLISVEVDPLLVSATAITAPSYAPEMNPVTAGYIGSAEAVETARDNGGADFLSGVAEDDVLTLIEGGNQYWLFDRDVDTRFWRVRFFDASDGDLFESFIDMYSGEVVTSAEPVPGALTALRLRASYPNPFNSATTIRFELAQPEHVDLRVYNLLGQKVRDLVQGKLLQAGPHEVRFEAGALPSGVYVYQLRTATSIQSGAVILRR